MQQEIKCPEICQLKPFHAALADTLEVLLDALGGDFPNQDRIKLIPERNQAHVGRIALIPRTRMGKVG